MYYVLALEFSGKNVTVVALMMGISFIVGLYFGYRIGHFCGTTDVETEHSAKRLAKAAKNLVEK